MHPVRRTQLQSPASSPPPSPDPALEALLRARAPDLTYTAGPAAPDVASDGDETELRLFAAPSTHAPQTHKIRLTSPGAGNGEPGFIVRKPRSYYFADDPSSEKDAEYRAAAVDGPTIFELSKIPWPGCALPWRVRTITPLGLKKSVLVGHPPAAVDVEEKVPKRRRKGKKSRMALRKKIQAARSKEEQRARAEQDKESALREKEAALKEKKTRRNREKKVKKKAKEKAKKMAEGENTEKAGEIAQAEAGKDIPEAE